MKGNQVLFIIWLKKYENMEMVTVYTLNSLLLPLKRISQNVVWFCRLLGYLKASLTYSEDPNQCLPLYLC